MPKDERSELVRSLAAVECANMELGEVMADLTRKIEAKMAELDELDKTWYFEIGRWSVRILKPWHWRNRKLCYAWCWQSELPTVAERNASGFYIG